MASPPTKRQRPTRPKPGPKPGTMSEETRQKLSRIAKERHARGEFGGAKFGKLGGRGKTREKRLAQQSVAEAAQEHAEQIIAVFKDAVDPDRPMMQRLRGAELWLGVERESRKLELAEEKATAEQLDRGTLIKLLAAKLSGGPTAALIQAQIEQGEEDIIEAEVVED